MISIQNKINKLQKELRNRKVTKANKARLAGKVLKLIKLESELEKIRSRNTNPVKEIIRFIELERGYTAKLWQKYGKNRIYLGRDNGVRVNQYGYIELLGGNKAELVRTHPNSGGHLMLTAKSALEAVGMNFSYR